MFVSDNYVFGVNFWYGVFVKCVVYVVGFIWYDGVIICIVFKDRLKC